MRQAVECGSMLRKTIRLRLVTGFSFVKLQAYTHNIMICIVAINIICIRGAVPDIAYAYYLACDLSPHQMLTKLSLPLECKGITNIQSHKTLSSTMIIIAQ